MTTTFNRRSFLGATLAAWPLIGTLARSLPLVHSTFVLNKEATQEGNMRDDELFTVTTYTNGTFKVTSRGKPMTPYSSFFDNAKKSITFDTFQIWHDSRLVACSIKVPRPDTLLVNWIKYNEPAK